MMPLNVRTENFRRRVENNIRSQGAVDTEQSRPSSSGGRLEQHLGAVESVELPSQVVGIVPSVPIVPRNIGFPAGNRVAAVAAPTAAHRVSRGEPVQGSGKGMPGEAQASGVTSSDLSRAFKGINNSGASFGSSGSRSLAGDEQHHLHGRNESGQRSVGRRRVRDRKDGSNRTSADSSPGQSVGAEQNCGGLVKRGRAGRGKTHGARTRPRQAAPQNSFGGNGGGASCGERKGAEQGEVNDAAGQADNSVETNKFRIQAGQSNILVAVRLRPLLKHDREHVEVAKVLDHRVVILMDPAKVNHEVDPLRVNRTREKRYAFDHVFDATATQKSVYENTTKFLIQGVLDGFNATVFAYGCTGAGKTYTMIGNSQEGHQGIMVLTLQDLFKQQRRVYNENIRDLLNDTGEFLDLREDPIKGPTVSGLAEVEAQTPEEIMDLLHQGNQSRTQQATRANAVSSRSHAVLQVVVESRDKAPGTVATMHIGKLSLVDLAGSERAAATQNRGVRLVEGANINRSLLALGNCINALGERGNKGQFVPYRDSKLTRLLKDSLGGNCRTVMIANISGASSSFEETLNTLKYANRAKNIKTNATRNSLDVNHHISEYVNLIGSLRTEITRLKHQLVKGGRSGCGVGGDGIGANQPEAMVFSPSLNASTNSLFTQSKDNERQELRGSRKKETESSRAATDDDESHPVIMAPLLTNNGGGSGGRDGGAKALTIDTDRAAPNSSDVLATIPGTVEASSSSRSAERTVSSPQDKDFVEEVREKIVENFQERMQLRRSLIELEDQNVQNSIEVGKRQLSLVEWHGGRWLPQEAASHALQGLTRHGGWAEAVAEAAEAAAAASEGGDGGETTTGASNVPPPPPEVKVAWKECEQLCSAISKNNETKRKISRRLRNNGRQAEKFKAALDGKITGEDRNQLMKLQYRIGKLELDNMELEQSRIVHESALRGKDLTIQKLQLQLAVRDRTITLQQSVLAEHGLDSATFPGAMDVDQVRMTDALDAFLPEGVVAGRNNSIERRPFHRRIGRIVNGEDDNDNDGVLISCARSRVGTGGRRGGWGSSSDSDRCDRYATRTTVEPNDEDSASNATVESGISSTVVHGMCTSSSKVVLSSKSTAQEPTATAKKERNQQPKDRLEQMIETTVGGAQGRWPKRRPSKTTSRVRQSSFQPPQPSRRKRGHHESRSVRLRDEDQLLDYNAATTAAARTRPDTGVEHSVTPAAQGDPDDDSFEDGLVASSMFPSKFEGGGDDGRCEEDRVEGGIPASLSIQRPPRQPSSVTVAPFHGPIPMPLAFGSGSDAPSLMASTTLDAPNIVDVGSGGAKCGNSNSFDEPTAVSGLSMGNHVPSKGSNDPSNNRSPLTKAETPDPGRGRVAPDSTGVFPVSSWDGFDGEGAVSQSGIDNDPRIEAGSGCDLVVIARKGGGTVPSSSGEGGGVSADRTDVRSSNQPPEPRRAPRLDSAVNSATGGGVLHRDHAAQPPYPLKHGLANADTTAQQPSGKVSSSRTGIGGNSMGISGTGMAPPWRNVGRRHVPTASFSATSVGGGGSGAGANRRRLRREQTRASTFSEGGGTAASHGTSDGSATTTTTKNGGSLGVNDTKSALLTPQRSGERLHVGGTGSSAVAGESEVRGGTSEDRHRALADPEGMILVASAVQVVGVGGSGEGGGVRSGSNRGWRAAGNSLANLKARMGGRHQQTPTASISSVVTAGGVANRKRNAVEGESKDPGPPYHIPHQTH